MFIVEKEVACMSALIKNMIDDTGCDEEIPLPNVKTAILQKVFEPALFDKLLLSCRVAKYCFVFSISTTIVVTNDENSCPVHYALGAQLPREV